MHWPPLRKAPPAEVLPPKGYRPKDVAGFPTDDASLGEALTSPVRGNGFIDGREVKVLEGIGTWREVNKEAILATRP